MSNVESLKRPQPVGILPIPAGLLVLPEVGPMSRELLQQCVESETLSDLPASWSFFQAARQGDWNATLELLDQCNKDQASIAAYNRFVLKPALDDLVALRISLTGDLRRLLDIAAYTVGLSDESPSAVGLDGELLALALMTQAAAELEKNATSTAISLLKQSAEAARPISPLFTAQILSQLAALLRTQSTPLLAEARNHYREAIALMGAAKLPETTSDLWMQLGMTCQEGAEGRDDWMTEAVHAYQEVLRGGLIPEQHAELFALAHNNLGLLFLSMRMSEGASQLRMAIAVQSFREGLRLCDRDAHAQLRASIQLNLANALQHLPSSHPEENLLQSVELYEELATQQRKAFDPVGYGRVLSNQANALAHLGIFTPALEKLQEARKLFEWHNESELASSALDLVGQIHEKIGATAGKN